MFIRIKNKPNNKKSIQIVENRRISGTTKQTIIKHVGVAETELQLAKLKDLADWMIADIKTRNELPLFKIEDIATQRIQARGNKEKMMVNVKNLREEKRVIVGIDDVYGKLYDELGYLETFKQPSRNISTSKILKDIVLARIANPLSKRASQEMLFEDFGKKISLDKIYRMMEKIDKDTIDKIKNITSENTKKIFKEELDVMFFDVTTLYFESFQEDELKKNGYSKDLKFNQPQILLSLLTTREGMPIDYNIHEGDTYEGHTLIPVLDKLREKHEIKRIILVADSGMLNAENIEALKERKIEYIVGARIKNTKKTIQEQLLKKDDFTYINENLRLKEIELEEDQKMIVSYKKSRAKKDKKDRDKAIEKLRKKFSKKVTVNELISNYGYKKFLKKDGTSNCKFVLDENKIKEAKKWDGLKGIVTNSDLKKEEVVAQYSRLGEIEAAFRITKHDLKIRPIYHWKPEKVKAHVAICFMAYTLLRHLNYRIKLIAKEKISIEETRLNLVRTQLSVVKDISTEKMYGIPSKLSGIGKKIYGSLGLKYSLVPFEIK